MSAQIARGRLPLQTLLGSFRGLLAGQPNLAQRSFAASSGKGEVIDLASDEDYTKEIKAATDKGKLCVVDFTAKWCGPCRVFAPVYQNMSETFPDVRFLKVDIDSEALQKTSSEHGITSIPTIVVMKGGKSVAVVRGADASGVAEAIMQHKS